MLGPFGYVVWICLRIIDLGRCLNGGFSQLDDPADVIQDTDRRSTAARQIPAKTMSFLCTGSVKGDSNNSRPFQENSINLRRSSTPPTSALREASDLAASSYVPRKGKYQLGPGKGHVQDPTGQGHVRTCKAEGDQSKG